MTHSLAHSLGLLVLLCLVSSLVTCALPLVPLAMPLTGASSTHGRPAPPAAAGMRAMSAVPVPAAAVAASAAAPAVDCVLMAPPSSGGLEVVEATPISSISGTGTGTGTGAAPRPPSQWPTVSPFVSTDPNVPTIWGDKNSDGVDREDPYCMWKNGQKACI